MFDDTYSGVLRRRYETLCERDLHRSITELAQLRKAGPPPVLVTEQPAPVEDAPEEPAPEGGPIGFVSPGEFDATFEWPETCHKFLASSLLRPSSDLASPDNSKLRALEVSMKRWTLLFGIFLTGIA